LAGRDVLIVADTGNHASLIDACRLAKSRVAAFEHGDLQGAGRELRDRSESRALLVIDAINSVEGDLLPLGAWHDLASRYGAILVVDDAHGLGVRGGGRGSVFEAGLGDAPDVVITATLSKSLGSQGGVVLGDRRVIDHLINTARSFIFDTGLNPPAVGAALESTRIVRQDPRLAAAVLHRSATIAGALDVLATDSAIVSRFVGDAHHALAMSQELQAQGLHVGCFRPPSVAIGQARLRLTANLSQSDADVARLKRAHDGLVVA
ncbi:MAG: aminotransferase class I/II-fold pyridoxal phosphate-dependent enzyme, partial [Candidatus Nanopelagicales bacterium]